MRPYIYTEISFWTNYSTTFSWLKLAGSYEHGSEAGSKKGGEVIDQFVNYQLLSKFSVLWS
jgi:hypothetical protein